MLAPLRSMVTFSSAPLPSIARPQKAQHRYSIAFGGQQEIHSVAYLVDGAVQVLSSPADLDARLIHSPRADR